jgi:hypothetical protein
MGLFEDGTFLVAGAPGAPGAVGAAVHEGEDGTIIAEIGDDRRLVVRRRRAADGDGAGPVVVECTGADVFILFVFVLGRRFRHGVDAAAWLRRHRIGLIGRDRCRVERVGLVDGVGVVFRSGTGGIIVPAGTGEGRVLLNALREVFADGTFDGLDGFTAWLTEHGADWRPATATGSRLEN